MEVFLIGKKNWLSPVKDTVDINEPNKAHIFGLSVKKQYRKFWVNFCYYPQYSV